MNLKFFSIIDGNICPTKGKPFRWTDKFKFPKVTLRYHFKFEPKNRRYTNFRTSLSYVPKFYDPSLPDELPF